METLNTDDTVLTERQAQILKLRGEGMTQNEVAQKLETSTPNVSTIEKRARKNLEKARNTLKLARELEAPLRLTIESDTDLYDVPGRIYEAADELGVKVQQSGPEILRLVHREAGSKLRDRAVRNPINVSVKNDGQVSIR